MKFKVGCKLCENDKGVRDLTSLVNKLLKYANKSIDMRGPQQEERKQNKAHYNIQRSKRRIELKI